VFSGEDGRLTQLERVFLEPANATHRQYEALRAFFVDKVPSKEVAERFGYTPGSFRVLCHHFRADPTREFFLPERARATTVHKPPTKSSRLREKVVAMRKANLSVYDIAAALAAEGEALSPPAIWGILSAEGFARLPRRAEEERAPRVGVTPAATADVRAFDLTPPGVPHRRGRACSCSCPCSRGRALTGSSTAPACPAAGWCPPGRRCAPCWPSNSPGRRAPATLRTTTSLGLTATA